MEAPGLLETFPDVPSSFDPRAAGRERVLTSLSQISRRLLQKL